jgi:hypothetical protein
VTASWFANSLWSAIHVVCTNCSLGVLIALLLSLVLLLI